MLKRIVLMLLLLLIPAIAIAGQYWWQDKSGNWFKTGDGESNYCWQDESGNWFCTNN